MEQIREELTALFEEMLTHIGEFKRKSYDSVFEAAIQKHKDTIMSIGTMISEAAEEEQEALIEEVASVIPNYACEKMHAEPKKKKERLSVDYNINMAVYILPMFNYYRNEACEKVARRTVELWNEKEVSTLTLSYATYNDISSGFKKRLCFITTAVCESHNKPDDCYELTTLRAYRDEYMMQTSTGRSLVEEYYDIAPGILKVIDMHKEKEAIYEDIYQTYLLPCISLIEEDKPETCQKLYQKMVLDLRKKYLYS